MEWFEDYFGFKKVGHKFVITSISDKEVKSMPDNRGGHNAIEYIDNIEELVLHMMVEDEDEKRIFLSKSKLMSQLKLINSNYGRSRANVPAVSHITSISEDVIEDWFNSTDSMFKRNIENALQKLRNQRLVMWSRVTTVYVDTTIETALIPVGENFFNEYGEEFIAHREVVQKVKPERREATEDECRLITKIEKEVMNSMECDDIQSIVGRKLWKRFNNESQNKVRSQSNITFYHKSYKVLFNYEHIEKASKDIESFRLGKLEKINHEQTVIKGSQHRNIENAQNRQNKPNRKHLYRLSSTYIEDYKKLNEIMLSSNPDMWITDYQIQKYNKSIKCLFDF